MNDLNYYEYADELKAKSKMKVKESRANFKVWQFETIINMAMMIFFLVQIWGQRNWSIWLSLFLEMVSIEHLLFLYIFKWLLDPLLNLCQWMFNGLAYQASRLSFVRWWSWFLRYIMVDSTTCVSIFISDGFFLIFLIFLFYCLCCCFVIFWNLTFHWYSLLCIFEIVLFLTFH